MFELLAGSLKFHFGPYKLDRLFKLIAAGFGSALRQEEYAYSLRKKLQAVGIDIEEGTLYPLVRRLEQQGLLHSQWREGEGRERRYYRISHLGQSVLHALVGEWQTITDSLQHLLKGTP